MLKYDYCCYRLLKTVKHVIVCAIRMPNYIDLSVWCASLVFQL